MKTTTIKKDLEKVKYSPLSCIDLLKKFQNKEIFASGQKLQFSGVKGKDVYNISKPFINQNECVIAGRVEARDACADSQIIFFKNDKDLWIPIYGAPTLQLEDSCVVKIGSEIIISGIEVYSNPSFKYPKNRDYRTVFYRGRDLFSLKRFAVGPEMMKDIRLAPLSNGHIGVFTRPQGGSNGKGKIGFVELKSLKEINPKNLLQAKVIENQFSLNNWGGVNDIHSFKNWIYAIGHVAYEDERNAKHYYAMSFIYNINTCRASEIKIIATRKNFPVGEIKTPEHEDIIFPSGLAWHGNNTATLYAGLSDAESGYLNLSNEKTGIIKKPVCYIFKNEN